MGVKKTEAQATKKANDEFYSTEKNKKLNGRALTVKEEDKELRKEWMELYKKHLQKLEDKKKASRFTVMIEKNKVQKFTLPSPKFKEGLWLDASQEEITDLRFNQSAWINIKTTNFPKKTKVTITLKHHEAKDPSWVKQISPIETTIINGEGLVELTFLKSWLENRIEERYKLYFQLTAQVQGKSIVFEFPKKEHKYLWVEPEKVLWPLKSNKIRRGMLNHTFGIVRHDAFGIKNQIHQGWDFEAKVGTETYAVADGVIDVMEKDPSPKGYGYQVGLKFKFNEKDYYAFYAHLKRIDVKTGVSIKAGDIIGLTGKTGNANILKREEDEHLHFEVRLKDGQYGGGLSNRISPLKIFGKCPLHEQIMQP